jgi:HSP20 family protein
MALPVRRTSGVTPETQPRWEPFRDLEQLHADMDRLMQTVWSPAQGGGTDGIWVPVADIEETDDAWIVEAEVPGVDRKDINVELRDAELVISGDIKKRERKGIVRRAARRTGRFEYRIALPGHAAEDQIEANLHDGVLAVRVPKSDQARVRRIEVKSS